MSKRGLPTGLKMRHDWHYVEELAKTPRSLGRMIAVDKIDPNPEQPRVEIGELTDLAASIKEHGVLEPLLVKPLNDHPPAQRWLIIAGERRWRAARLAGLTEVPCLELDLDAQQIAEIALIENLQRKDLTVWEEADGLAALCQKFGYTHEDVARRIGKSRSTVTESLTIAALPRNIKDQCQTAKLNSKSAILQIARQFDEAAMLDALQVIQSNRLQAANAETELRELAAPGNQLESETDDGRDGHIPRAAVKTPQIATRHHTTDLSSPVRAYSYQPLEGEYRLALKFKKPVDKNEIISTLREIISELEQT